MTNSETTSTICAASRMRSFVAGSIIGGGRSSVLLRAGLCRGWGSLPGTRMRWNLLCTRQTWQASLTPQSSACLGPRTLREANRVPVLGRAHCAKPIECLFWSAHTARSQSSACLGPRTLREANRAPVWVRALCAKGACGPRRVWLGTRQTWLASLTPRAGLCRGRKVCSGSKCISSAFPITLKRLVRALLCDDAC